MTDETQNQIQFTSKLTLNSKYKLCASASSLKKETESHYC